MPAVKGTDKVPEEMFEFNGKTEPVGFFKYMGENATADPFSTIVRKNVELAKARRVNA